MYMSEGKEERKQGKKRHTMAIKGYGYISLAKAWGERDMNVLPQESIASRKTTGWNVSSSCRG